MNYPKIFDKSRLDILIYAQDGRGLGHVSRSAAIGMALRRLYPELKVLLLTGFRDTQMLLGECPLDWMKLPSYETLIEKGRARGKIGDMNLKNCYLGPAREKFIESIVWEFRPRLILVDHLPLGRKDELSSSLILSLDTDTRWVLGMRSISGDDNKLWSEESSKTFKKHYDSLLWYGDKSILGSANHDKLESFFSIQARITGYVSRFMEIIHWQQDGIQGASNVVSLPWMTKETKHLLNTISGTLKKLGDRYGHWRFFVNMKGLSNHAAQEKEAIETLPFCSFEQLSDQYFNALKNANLLITYGGYNSLCDVIAAGVPSIVVTRSLNDREQEEHVKCLKAAAGQQIIHLREGSISSETLYGAIKSQVNKGKMKRPLIKLSGAEETAHILANYLKS